MHRRDFCKFATAAAAPAWAASQIPTHVAIQNVCAWPNVQKLRDETLLAMIFNQPCHGRWEGDLDCWESKDNGRTWRFRSRVAPHEKGANRMNCAAGILTNGDLLVLCSGWDNKGPAGVILPGGLGNTLRPWICRSSDQGRTWKIAGHFPDPPPTDVGKNNQFIPFGGIETAADGSVCASAYVRRNNDRASYLFRSRDNGASWTEMVPLNPGGNETWILHCKGSRWLAASRQSVKPGGPHYVHLYTSDDDARTWQRGVPLSMPGQVTGNLMRLSTGRVLFTYGNRNWGNYGVDARLSDDEGKTWSPPFRIADSPYGDSGYPSTVELRDGSVITAYYTKVSDDYHYEMRVAAWNPRSFSATGTQA